MDTRGPYAHSEAQMERRNAALHFINELNHRVGALNLLHSQHRYNLTHGSEIERDRANTILPRLNTVIRIIENRIRSINNEIAGIDNVGMLDPNSPQWEQEYAESLEVPQQAGPGSEN